MTAERSERALEAEVRIGASEVLSGEMREQQDPASEARARLLDEHADFYAGHERFDKKNDKWVLERDGVLRTIALESDARGELFHQRAKSAREKGEETDDNTLGENPDQYFSFHRFVKTYGDIRKKHEMMFADNPEETSIPAINRSLARTVLREYVGMGKIILAKGYKLEDIDFISKEDDAMFRFPPTEYHRDRAEMEEAKDLFKKTALNVARKSKKQRSQITGNPADSWLKPSDVVLVFDGLKANSKFANEDVWVSLSESAAEALIREYAEHDMWDEIDGGDNLVTEEPYFRQTPLHEDS